MTSLVVLMITDKLQLTTHHNDLKIIDTKIKGTRSSVFARRYVYIRYIGQWSEGSL